METAQRQGHDIQSAQVKLASHLRSLLGLSPRSHLTWVRVAQVTLEYLKWEQIQRALGDYLTPHENEVGAINNLRQITVTTTENYNAIRKVFGELFVAYHRFTASCNCAKWSPEREKQMKEFIRLMQVWRIELPDDIKKEIG